MKYEEMFDSLHERFPKLITNQTMIECDVGWYKLIFDYCLMTERLVEKEICKYTSIICIKEKFGSMRLHHSINANDVDFEICNGLQIFTESKSRFICEKCGKFGDIKKVNGWLKCLCNDCEERKYEDN